MEVTGTPQENRSPPRPARSPSVSGISGGANPSSEGTARNLTVMVFQDSFAARTFQVPLRWISRFGLIMGALVGAAVFSSFFAFKFYRISRHADPARVQDLEHELTELRATNEALQSKTLALVTEQDRSRQQTPPTAATDAPAGTPPAANPRASAPAAPQAGDSTGALLFSALPSKISLATAESGAQSIKIHAPRLAWAGKTLRVSFDIQYVGPDKGSQQGRIILLARGPEAVLAHPNGVLNVSGSDALISPDQGEYFSVSRFRTVTAEFGPVRSQNALREVEVILLNQDAQVLIHEILKPGQASETGE